MSTAPIRIFLLDDHPLVREWLGNLLRLQRDFIVSGEASDSATALATLATHPADVAIIDLSLKRGSGLDLIKDLATRLPRVRPIVLSMHEELGDIERAFRAGARGYVRKSESTGLIVNAIRTVHAGEIFAAPELLAQLAARLVGRPAATAAATPETLSDRELDVFRRLGAGHATKRIAEELGVSLKTVQTYCARIKEKLALADGAELVREATRWHDGRSSRTSV